MGGNVLVNGLTLVHKGSNGISRCTIPDVCKTPSPGGPVPVPYPVIISRSADLANGTKKVKAEGGKMIAIKGSEFTRCNGDEAGTAGGVKSSTNMKEAKWILYSFNVKLEGKNVCRLSDKMTMNHANTMCLAGEKQGSGGGTPGSNKAQNKQFRQAISQAEKDMGKKLSKDQKRRVHDEIHGEDMGFWEIVKTAKSMFG